MKIFYSGDDFSHSFVPETILPNANVCLTFFWYWKGSSNRLEKHVMKPKKKKKKKKIDSRQGKERIGCLFLDSGAHSLYNMHASKVRASKGLGDKREVYAFYETDDFWKYVDEYAKFVKKHLDVIDYYVNVDAIFNPEITWKVQKYLEDKHGLNPLPVIHYGTPMKWIDRYLKEGYEFIGLGGVGQGVGLDAYFKWADVVYRKICPSSNNQLPVVRTHGFAMTAYKALLRYPWWSVDSASWVKAGGFGMLYVPRRINGKFTFEEEPLSISISATPPNMEKEEHKERLEKRNARALFKKKRLHHPSIEKGTSFHNLSPGRQQIVKEWLDQIGVPLGSVDDDGAMVEWGVVSHHAARKVANLWFFEALCDWLPEWPWKFQRNVRVPLL